MEKIRPVKNINFERKRRGTLHFNLSPIKARDQKKLTKTGASKNTIFIYAILQVINALNTSINENSSFFPLIELLQLFPTAKLIDFYFQSLFFIRFGHLFYVLDIFILRFGRAAIINILRFVFAIMLFLMIKNVIMDSKRLFMLIILLD